MRNPLKREDKGYEAFPAVVIADKTDHLGKRLGQFALWILVLFFTIGSMVQSARNARLLEGSSKDRSDLIQSMDRVTRTLDAQSDLIIKLQDAIRQQNDTLRKAGLTQVGIPNYTLPAPYNSPSSDIPRASPRPRNSPSPTPKPKPNPKPTPSPSPSPSPSPGPAQTVRDEVCSLTGICPSPRSHR